MGDDSLLDLLSVIIDWMVEQLTNASDTMLRNGMVEPLRLAVFAVIMHVDCESFIRSDSDGAENPPKTTEWMAPIRLQANMAITASGTNGM